MKRALPPSGLPRPGAGAAGAPLRALAAGNRPAASAAASRASGAAAAGKSGAVKGRKGKPCSDDDDEEEEDAEPSQASDPEPDGEDEDEKACNGSGGEENEPPRKVALSAAQQHASRAARAASRGRFVNGVRRPSTGTLGPRKLPPWGSTPGGGGGAAGAPAAPPKAQPYKCPVLNYTGQLGVRGTLGPARRGLGGAMVQLSRALRTMVLSKEGDGSVHTEPLCIFDPAKEPEGSPKRALSAIWVEAWLAAQLRSHQREGVAFAVACCAGLRQEGMAGCVLGDGMGLGKTFQAIATLWVLLTTGPHGKPAASKPLVLCPPSLVANWGKELEKWLQGRVAPIAVVDTKGQQVKNTLSTFGGFHAQRCGKPQVLVMGYQTFRDHRDAVTKKGIDIVICDEAHFLKNGEAVLTKAVASLPAKMRILLSGTPIQNDLTEFFSLFNVAVPGLLGEPAHFRRFYENPILRGNDAEASDAEARLGSERQAQLTDLCGRFLLRRTCALMKKYLPPKVEQVVFCRMAPLQARLYDFFLKSPAVQAAIEGRQEKREKATAIAARKAAKEAAKEAGAGGRGGGKAGGRGGGKAGRGKAGRGGGGGADSDASGDEGEGGGGGATAGAGALAATVAAAAADPPVAGGGGDAAAGGAGGQPPPRLTVLAAITAVKKMCCHPDLVYDMVAPKPAKARVAAPPPVAREAPKRAAANAAAAAFGAADSDGDDSDFEGGGGGGGGGGGKKKGGGGGGTGKGKGGKAGGGGAGGGGEGGGGEGEGKDKVPREVVTGFEGCLPLFNDPTNCPAYKPRACQSLHGGKIAVLEMILKAVRDSRSGDKVVIVSNYTEALDMLAVMCNAHSWSWMRLDGDVNNLKRQPVVDTFNDPSHPSFVLLLSSKAGGVGLNIIGANRLVLFDPDWNPANDLQAMARVWRQGQTKKVWIYRLLTTGSIEEKIFQRQIAKMGLSNAIVDESAVANRMSGAEMKALFEINRQAKCDTHNCIKCSCDGKPATAVAKMADNKLAQEAAAAAAAAAAKAAAEAAAAKEAAEAAAAAAAAADAMEEDGGGEDKDKDKDQKAAEVKKEGAGAGEEHGPPPVDDSLIRWAHLEDVGHSPDPIWKTINPWMRDRYITYLFSDHIVNDIPKDVPPGEEEEEEVEEEEDKERAEKLRKEMEDADC
ncbi:hypothetical protein HYH03_007025 [Edaphochlamys debaryana]|uniref:Uncharacterized protein n=1 Tax=Edaphochlamys debaryana TaxID=47281 RepID=A0A835Y409_9CHLO|nr:hypothetical protein HYH03_007025 [Edaphochlamys debaryana]|eukprot:KAG2494782.1 hypothetical protein HYH03_007025 [Edaphochlamys debaryana]